MNIVTILKSLAAHLVSIDHIQPQSLGGTDDLNNLALACRRCNERRYNFTTGIDPNTGIQSPLFNPRQDTWSDHFIWSSDATRIIGKTAIGRATSDRLDLNDDRRHDQFIQSARQIWRVSGWHPPAADSRQQTPPG